MFSAKYDDLISVDNLLTSWQRFLKGKKDRPDVQEFEYRLMDNILQLHEELKTRTYKHSGYKAFNIADPKPRNIHKAKVRDRLVHHAIYHSLYWFFDTKFIYDSYSCRRGKGAHKALKRFNKFAYQVGQNNTKTVWILRCDIKKFFASIDQTILISLLMKYLDDQDTVGLIIKVIKSFNIGRPDKGLPLGNLTSQLLVNVYMNEFDQFVKHKLKAKYYIRYADDFVIMAADRNWLLKILPKVGNFLEHNLKLSLHPDKVFIKTLASGVDFLDWVHSSDHRVLRSATKRRMLKRVAENSKESITQSYLGLLSHGNGWKL